MEKWLEWPGSNIFKHWGDSVDTTAAGWRTIRRLQNTSLSWCLRAEAEHRVKEGGLYKIPGSVSQKDLCLGFNYAVSQNKAALVGGPPQRANKPSLVFAWANLSHVPFLFNFWRLACCLAYCSTMWCPPLPRPGLRTWDLCYVIKTQGQRSSQLFAKWSLSAGEI